MPIEVPEKVQKWHHNPDSVKPKEIIFDGRKL